MSAAKRLSFSFMFLVFAMCCLSGANEVGPVRVKPAADGLLSTEKLVGEGVWVHSLFEQQKQQARRIRVKVWFDEQLLGDGKAYRRRAKEFENRKRRELRSAIVKTLKALSDKSYNAAKASIDMMIADEKMSEFERHWTINGFSCTLTPDGLKDLKAVHGVKKIFVVQPGRGFPKTDGETPVFKPVDQAKFDPDQYKHPWYIRYLKADQVWKKFGITGKDTLNIVHDYNYVYSDNVSGNVFRNPNETPGNEKDDDGNGLVDDYHGFNFDRGWPARLLDVCEPPLHCWTSQQWHPERRKWLAFSTAIAFGGFRFAVLRPPPDRSTESSAVRPSQRPSSTASTWP